MFVFSPSTFREDYPEFSDPLVFSDGVLTRWALVASKLLNADRWCELIGFGTGLWIAHQLAMAKQNQKAAATGGTPGQINGPITSKTVSKVSVSYDPSAVTIEGGGNYNATSYGRDFLYHGQLLGAGPIQLSGHGEPHPAYPGTDIFFGEYIGYG